MALRLITKNANAFNKFILVKNARFIPVKGYSTLFNSQHRSLFKPLSLIKKPLQPTPCNITLSLPRASATTSSHTTLWTLERALSLLLLGVIPIGFIVPSQTLDVIMAMSLVLHSHWGIEAMVTDYVRPAVVGNILPKVAHASLLMISIATLGGLFYLIYNDIGIAKSIKKLWSVKSI